MLWKLLKKLKLKYDDPAEEQEYHELKFPFVTKFNEVISFPTCKLDKNVYAMSLWNFVISPLV